MRATRSRVGLVARLQRLEARGAGAANEIKLRFGHLRRLPPDYQGEKHVVIIRRLPDREGQEWVEFEEVPGPDPGPQRNGKRDVPRYINVVFVKAYPIPGEAEPCR